MSGFSVKGTKWDTTFVVQAAQSTVSNTSQLLTAINAATANGGNYTIYLNDATYTLADALYINVPNVTLRSTSGNRSAVILQGDVMSSSSTVPFNVRIAAAGLILQDLTLGGKCLFSALQIVGESGATGGTVRNCIIRDSYEHLVKASTGVLRADNWLIENSYFYFTAGMSPAQYNGGIDAHGALNWIVRNNVFQDIASPVTSANQHAINWWNASGGWLVEKNKIIDCDRGIGDGLSGNPANDNSTIRNNMIYHSANSDPYADVPLIVENATNSKVYNNTIFALHNYANAIEYRFTTTGADIRNNLTNLPITSRNGGTATVSNNVTSAVSGWFLSPATGDLHLASSVSGVTDSGATISSVLDDFDGTSRPQGTSYDIGADEIVSGGGSGPLSLPLYDTSKITYLGKFYLPNDGSSLNGTAGLAYGGRPSGIAFNPAGNGGLGSLFISGGPESFEEVVGEFSIPVPKISAPFNRATALQTLQLTAAGKQSQIQSGAAGVANSGLMVYNGRLIHSWLSFYNTNPDQATGFMARTSLTLAGGTSTNAVRVGNLTNQRFMAGLGSALPSNWSTLFGGYTAVGGAAGGISISGNYSCGPAMVLFNPDNITGAGPVAGAELSYYQQGDIDGGFGPYSSIWTNNSFHRGTFFLPESRTVICFGRHGDSVYVSGTGNESIVQCRTRLWLYDAVDLKRVYDGLVSPRSVLPYATFDINEGPNNTVPQGDEIRGGTWDAVGRKLYVRANHEEGSWPAVFVFSIPA